MRKKKKLIQSLLLFAFTILLMVSSTYAWLTLDIDSQVNEVILPVGKQDISYSLQISRNEGVFQTITTTEEMMEMLENAVPGDSFDFRLHITNLSTSAVKTTILLGPIQNENANVDFDMRDVFIIDRGKVNFKGSEKSLSIDDEEPVFKHGQQLSPYRLTHLMGVKTSILLLQEGLISVGSTETLAFRLTYDHTTSKASYQEGKLKLNRFTIYFVI